MSTTGTVISRMRRSHSLDGILTIVVCSTLFLSVSFLPADTSLSEARDAGQITVCTPLSYPPLVTRDPDEAGFDIELLSEVAARLDLSLSINPNPAIGRDFNPRNCRVTRAQCQILAGGCDRRT